MILLKISEATSLICANFSLRKLNYEPIIQHGQKPPLLRKLESYNPKIRKEIF